MMMPEDKARHYVSLLPQLSALVDIACEEVSVLANVSACLHQSFHWLWTGFYLVRDKQLILGPFQGDVACYTIGYGKGVCGTAWQKKKTIVVDNVHEFPGHIACSNLSQSEIVVPLTDAEGKVHAVLDIDSERLACFDDTDKQYLEQAMDIVATALYRK